MGGKGGIIRGKKSGAIKFMENINLLGGPKKSVCVWRWGAWEIFWAGEFSFSHNLAVPLS